MFTITHRPKFGVGLELEAGSSGTARAHGARARYEKSNANSTRIPAIFDPNSRVDSIKAAWGSSSH